MNTPLSFARGTAIILFEAEADNMISNWSDYIVTSKTKKGVYSVFARKYYENFESGRYKHKMGTLHAVKNIKKPLDFVAAILICADSLNIEITWEDILDKLDSLDAPFSKQVALYVDKL